MMNDIKNLSTGIDRSEAVRLIETVIATGDQTVLQPFVDSMISQTQINALHIMAVSGDKPDLFGQFLIVARSHGLINMAESLAFIKTYSEASKGWDA